MDILTSKDLDAIDHFMLLDTFPDSVHGRIIQKLFLNPITTLSTRQYEQLPQIFALIEEYIQKDFYVVGYFSYEMGHFFRKKKGTLPATSTELCRLGVYPKFQEVNLFSHYPDPPPLPLASLTTDISKQEYIESLLKIKEDIHSGLTYQVNFSIRLLLEMGGTTLDVYENLRSRFQTPYSALLRFSRTEEYLSFSPELFYKKENSKVTVKPMKGTGFQGEGAKLHTSKNKAENFMIVDLLRNDLGQISIPGSVKVKNLLNEEKYGTILQLTSEISSKLLDSLSVYNFFKAMFPSGSITGAPKENAMQSISILESTPRGIYTGGIGYFSPNGNSQFNVAIRTLKKSDSHYTMGVGSGIVYDSDPELEWNECHQKAFFLYRSFKFFIFESILFKNGTLYFLEEHIQRMRASSLLLFGHFEESKIRNVLHQFLPQISLPYKVRLIYFDSGDVKVESIENKPFKNASILLSDKKVHSNELFLYHKTSQRKLYTEEYEAYKNQFLDVIFRNEKEEITEGCISNIFILYDGIYITPPVSSGLLNGIYRRKLLDKFPKSFQEKKITKEMLYKSQKIFICNSIKGIIRVNLSETKN
jgi:para-aminobenzoate synthetase / 4-amino-4-deoxychorismate lyase